MYHGQEGTYHLFQLKNRYNQHPLPQVILADMKQELRQGNASAISSVLRRELEENLARGEQSIFVPQPPGASRMGLCGECGRCLSAPGAQ